MRRVAAVLGLAIAGSQAGHLLAYELRFGPAALHVQSTGAHAYFPVVVKTFVGGAALALVACLFLVAFARVGSGGRVDKGSAPSLLRLASVLYTLQLACFVVQETVEGGAAGQVVLWGIVCQLPVALALATALRWLLARVAPAVAHLAQAVRPVLQLIAPVLAPAVRPALAVVYVSTNHLAGPLTRRGPPPSF